MKEKRKKIDVNNALVKGNVKINNALSVDDSTAPTNTLYLDVLDFFKDIDGKDKSFDWVEKCLDLIPINIYLKILVIYFFLKMSSLFIEH